MFDHYDPVSFPTEKQLQRLRIHSFWDEDDIAAYVHYIKERQFHHRAWLSRKPVGTFRDYDNEDSFLRLYEPVIGEFHLDPPQGVSFRDHLHALVIKIREVQHAVWRDCDEPPKCAISGPEFAASLEFIGAAIQWDTERGLFSDIEVHTELSDCIPPYFIPRGELHLYYGWRYKISGEQDVRWPEPVGIIQIDDLIEPAMVTLARAVR